MSVWGVTVVRDGDEPYHFASVDGVRYIGTSRLPVEGEEVKIQALLDGDGNFRPMTIARRWFQILDSSGDDEVTFHDPATTIA